MSRKAESLEMRLHRLRNEERALERWSFIVSIILALVGASAFSAILYWTFNYTNIFTNLIEKAAP
ncbi:MAG: hypothetical protein L3J37_00205 [Rhodobacteraceae bacterium]|nr:hypothetical protein [Paracoccaceae bacterium]